MATDADGGSRRRAVVGRSGGRLATAVGQLALVLAAVGASAYALCGECRGKSARKAGRVTLSAPGGWCDRSSSAPGGTGWRR